MKSCFDARKITGVAGMVAAVLLAFASNGHAQTNLYNSINPANPQTGVVSFMQIVNPSDGTNTAAAGTAGTYTLTSFQLGINFNTGGFDQGVEVLFYTGVNTSATAANALTGATYVGGVSGILGAPGGSGNYTYTFTPNSPVSLPTPNGSFGVVFQLLDDTLSTYSTDMNGRFATATPTVGSAPGYVWNDANQDGVFAGAEQTKFGLSNAYVRFSMGGSFAAVPEPGTWTLLAGGLVVLGAVGYRRIVA